MPIPAELQTREQFTAAYDNLAIIADATEVAAELRERSRAFHAAHASVTDVSYGTGPRQVYDWYPVQGDGTAAPVLVFIHGGYWQARDKRDFSCVGAGPLAAGFHVVMAEYTLAPGAKVPDMVGEIGLLLEALRAHPVLGDRAGSFPRIVLSGHSAGGHLAAMHRAHAAVAGVLAISGLFDLEPIRRGALNDALGLREQDVAGCSPLARIGRGAATVVAVGGAELPELQRQSREYQAGLRDAGEASRLLEIPHANHLSILAELEGREGVLLAAALALAEQARR